MSHAGKFFCLTISVEYALCKMFPLSHACHGVSRLPAAGSQVGEKGLPGDRGSEARLGLSANTKHDPALSSAVEQEATTSRGWALPPCWARHSHQAMAGLPLHTAAAERRVAPAFLPYPRWRSWWPWAGRSGLGGCQSWMKTTASVSPNTCPTEHYYSSEGAGLFKLTLQGAF